MKKWTEAQARAENITDYEQFNKEYNAHKGTINGGIDRSVVPENDIEKEQVLDKAFHAVRTQRHGDFAPAGSLYRAGTQTTGKGKFDGICYNTYAGEYVTLFEQEHTDLKDGMVQIEFSTHIYADMTFSMSGGAQHNKGVKLRIEWNGVPLVETFYFTLPIQTVRIFAHTFTAGGTNTLTVKAKMTPKGATDYLANCQMHFWGMTSMLIGRWR